MPRVDGVRARLFISPLADSTVAKPNTFIGRPANKDTYVNNEEILCETYPHVAENILAYTDLKLQHGPLRFSNAEESTVPFYVVQTRPRPMEKEEVEAEGKEEEEIESVMRKTSITTPAKRPRGRPRKYAPVGVTTTTAAAAAAAAATTQQRTSRDAERSQDASHTAAEALEALEKHKRLVGKAIALEVELDLQRIFLNQAVPRYPRRDIKVEAYLNGELAANKMIEWSTEESAQVRAILSGRRIAKALESAWVVQTRPSGPATTSVDLKWQLVNEEFLVHADNSGFSARGSGRSLSGSYLNHLRNVEFPDLMWCYPHEKYAILDVIVSVGKGDRCTEHRKELVEPRMMEDPQFPLSYPTQSRNPYMGADGRMKRGKAGARGRRGWQTPQMEPKGELGGPPGVRGMGTRRIRQTGNTRGPGRTRSQVPDPKSPAKGGDRSEDAEADVERPLTRSGRATRTARSARGSGGSKAAQERRGRQQQHGKVVWKRATSWSSSPTPEPLIPAEEDDCIIVDMGYTTPRRSHGDRNKAPVGDEAKLDPLSFTTPEIRSHRQSGTVAPRRQTGQPQQTQRKGRDVDAEPPSNPMAIDTPYFTRSSRGQRHTVTFDSDAEDATATAPPTKDTGKAVVEEESDKEGIRETKPDKLVHRIDRTGVNVSTANAVNSFPTPPSCDDSTVTYISHESLQHIEWWHRTNPTLPVPRMRGLREVPPENPAEFAEDRILLGVRYLVCSPFGPSVAGIDSTDDDGEDDEDDDDEDEDDEEDDHTDEE